MLCSILGVGVIVTVLAMNDDTLEEQDLPDQGKARCPMCGSFDIRRSSSQGFVAAINLMMGRRPFRCRSCRRRFYRFAAPDPND